MRGWIIPAPLATPARYTGFPPASERRTHDLGNVSVVMMARETAEAFSMERLSARVGSWFVTRPSLERHPDDARGGQQDLRGFETQQFGRRARALPRRLQALAARAGVGIAGVHQHRASSTIRGK